jgi:hypothetical protein
MSAGLVLALLIIGQHAKNCWLDKQLYMQTLGSITAFISVLYYLWLVLADKIVIVGNPLRELFFYR